MICFGRLLKKSLIGPLSRHRPGSRILILPDSGLRRNNTDGRNQGFFNAPLYNKDLASDIFAGAIYLMGG